MRGFRPERLAEQVKQVLIELLLYGVKDPRLADVSVSDVEVTRDLQLARVYYTVNGDEQERKDARKALEKATPFLRHNLADELEVRTVPDVKFIYDDSQERGRRIDDLLRQVGGVDEKSDDAGDSADD